MAKQKRGVRTPKNSRGPQKPEWFLHAHYDYLENLDDREWYDELLRIRQQSEKHNLGLHTLDPNVLDFPNGAIGQIDVPTVMIVARESMTPRPAAQISEQSGLWCDQGVFIPIAFSPALLVHLNATDKDIHDEVKRVLREIRKLHHPSIASPPKRKAGQYSLNTLLDEKTFKRWRDNKIVQFASLLMWRASLDEKAAKPYKNKVLGEWLELPSEKETSEAKATLKNALANLPALLTQITLTQTTKGVSSLNSSPANWPV